MVERRGGFLPAACSAALLCALGACSTDTSGLELRRPGSAGAAVTGDNGAGGSPAPSEAPAPPLDPMDTPPSDEPPRLAVNAARLLPGPALPAMAGLAAGAALGALLRSGSR